VGWLDPSDDEVQAFHPAFESAGNEALAGLGLEDTHRWVHHPPSASSRTVPDFALVDESGNWILVIELKRTPTAVYSGRSQVQAKGYAEANQQRFKPGWPVYFAITNLEVMLFCAMRGSRPPAECVVAGGSIGSGSFATSARSEHRSQFVADLTEVVSGALAVKSPEFELAWPSLVAGWEQHSASLARHDPPGPPEPGSRSWEVVRSYYGQPPSLARARLILLQALLADFIRGRLIASGHERAAGVPIPTSRRQLALTIGALRQIDFDAVFDPAAAERHSRTGGESGKGLDAYVEALTRQNPGVGEMAATRQDYIELIEGLLLAIYPLERQAAAGKIQTDPELAAVLATLAIEAPGKVIDPCCGDGALLVAALDRLLDLDPAPGRALNAVHGIEVDPIAPRLAATRVALRAAGAVDRQAQPTVVQGDMFASADAISDAAVVLMNPPFRRYEDQGGANLPEALLDHYRRAVEGPGRAQPESLGGQPNLFHYYVEFVARTIPAGTRIGFVLDNKWYNNRTGRSLRELLKKRFRLVGLVEYPHRAFFTSWDIATSLLIAIRDDDPADDGQVRFIRSRRDPRGANLKQLAAAFHEGGRWPTDWTVEAVNQGELDPAQGWKRHFASALAVDLESLGLTRLSDLFARSRRGSLEKEGGGSQAFAFPFTRRSLKWRLAKGNGRPFNTSQVGRLTDAEEAALRDAASAIGEEFRGRALKNSDQLDSYELELRHVVEEQTLEPPVLRRHPELFEGPRRSSWTAEHRDAVFEIESDERAGAFLRSVEQATNLTREVLPDRERFVDLREPYAGELIVPRKLRAGHRVHVNPFAFDPDARQVRLSTNFVTYGQCRATDDSLGRAEAARLIAAFLVSSFGQLQFEQEGANREGLLAIEKDGIDRLLVLDPRSISPGRRAQILAELASLPFPVAADVVAADQPRVELDRLFAEELAPRCGISPESLLGQVHDAIDEWIAAREP
jgi:hypothetical protein